MAIPASGFISPETDGSFGVVLKNGLYIWKINKRFDYNGENIWLPIRSERQEINFVPNRVNACNQCHQERSQLNIDKYTNYQSIAATKMRGNLNDVTDISSFSSYAAVPDFHRDIVPLLIKKSISGDKSCIDCHKPGTKLNLSNFSGPDVRNSTYRNVVLGASRLNDTTKIDYLDGGINPMGTDNDYGFAPLFWSLLMNDDLSVAPDDTHSDKSSRSLERVGDYGASYSDEVNEKLASINAQYDHSKHLSKSDLQTLVIYSNTRLPAVLSDRSNFVTQGGGYRSSDAGQKAYQAMVRKCFNCHNSFTSVNGGGIEDAGFGLPIEKVFSSKTGQRDKRLRFIIKSHLANKTEIKYSQSVDISNLTKSMDQTLLSATYRIDFDKPEQSELLLYALGKDKLNTNGTVHTDAKPLIQETHHVKHNAVLTDSDPDYLAIKNWVMNTTEGIVNNPPIVDSNQGSLVLTEYDDPAYLSQEIKWTDPDGDDELAQLFIQSSGSSTQGFNDTMLALDYTSLKSAHLKTYAILGDRQISNFKFSATDGQKSSSGVEFPVTVNKGNYSIPIPSSNLPNAYAYYTVTSGTGNGTCADDVDELGELHKLTIKADDLNTSEDESLSQNDICIGVIAGYSTNWTTVYRRSDRGWLYFMDQSTQKIHVVNENNARVLFTVQLDHAKNKETDSHKQTQYLLWWRLADGVDYSSDDRWKGADGVAHTSDVTCSSGELQGILESKLSETLNGDWYVGLGCDESMLDTSSVTAIALSDLTVSETDNDSKNIKSGDLVDTNGDLVDTNGDLLATQTYIVVPRYRKRLVENDMLSVYVWKKATFLTKVVQDGIDHLNVLNLFTGKDKSLGNFSYTTVDSEGNAVDLNNDGDHDTVDYYNVRAVVVAEDGAFYGFGKDLNQEVKIFNFDPLNKTQAEISNIPPWLASYMNNIGNYGTPFLVIDERN